MSSKQLLRVAALLAMVLLLWGVAALVSRSANNPESARILPTIDTAAIDTIAITGPDDSAILARQQADRWSVNGYPADAQLVSSMLGSLADTGISAELIARNPSSHARLRVTADSGRRVRIVGDGGVIAELIAGKKTSDWSGAYLRRSSGPEVYAVQGELPTALARPKDEWRNRTIAGVNPDSVEGIEIRRGSRSYAIRRQGNGWVFGSGVPADSAAVAKLLSGYKEIKVAGFAAPAQEDSLRFERPRRTARLVSQRGTQMVSLAFDSIPSGTWVWLADRAKGGGPTGREGERAYRLDSWTADQLTPADSTLRKRQADDPPSRLSQPGQPD